MTQWTEGDQKRLENIIKALEVIAKMDRHLPRMCRLTAEAECLSRLIHYVLLREL